MAFIKRNKLFDLWSQCAASWPIVESILENLSATDASAFLSATKLISQLPSRTCNRYLDICRDLPDAQIEWIKMMLSKGHVVLLAGHGLHDLLFRYRDPIGYWNQRISKATTTLWLLPLSLAVADSASTEVPFITKDGTVNWAQPQLEGQERYVEMHRNHCGGLLCGNSLSLSSIMVPGPNLWPQCYLDWYTPQRWNTAGNNSGDSIKLVCATDASRDHLRMGLNLHPEWSSILKEVLPQHPETAIPYINMNTRRVSQTVLGGPSSIEAQENQHAIVFPYSAKEGQSLITSLSITFLLD